MNRNEERAAWRAYEQEAKKSARFELLAKICMVAAVIALGLIPLRAALPPYVMEQAALPRSEAGALQALWLLSQESVLPVSLSLSLAVIFANKIETKS